MKYCPSCRSEYRDFVETCSDCLGVSLIREEEMRRRGLPLPNSEDTRRFVLAGTAEDPLTADAFSRALEEAHIPCQLRNPQGAAVDKLTDGNPGQWWELWVPEEQHTDAALCLSKVRNEIESGAEDAARAAEEEALSTR